MSNYIDHRLSVRASREFRRIASGNTTIVGLASGNEVRGAKWKYKKMKFAANFALLTPETQEEIASAFYAADAMRFLFRFRDYGDYRVDSSPIATEDGTRTPVQLTKRYIFGPRSAERMIQAVRKAVVYDSLGAVVPGTVDDVLGIFTPDNNWSGAVHTWSGTYDCWVRFNSDDLDMTMLNLDIATVDVELIEQRAVKA